MQEYFRGLADQQLRQGYSWYEANTAAMFWLRRSMDKTDAEFFALLQLALQTLDPEFRVE
jgi:hypothetical protein